MKKPKTLFHPVWVFILAQLAWLSLVGLWIYWYVSNYYILEKVEEKVSPQLLSTKLNIFALISGCILLVLLLAGMYFIFIYLTRQINLTRMYDNFIANITHELKSPLASLQLYLETLKFRRVPRERQEEFLQLMIHDTKRLQRLINSILEISAIEQKRMAYNYQVYRAEVLIRELVREAEAQFKLPPNSIHIKGNVPVECMVDRNALKMVFDNLIDNAIKYSIESPAITIKLNSDSKYLTVKFIDNGVGIPLADQKKIFHKFYRVPRKDIPNIKGTGLGLYMVREIVKLHRGKISVYSEGKNHGSAFTITLPIYQPVKRRAFNRLLPNQKSFQTNQERPYEEESVHK
ncbi:MAG: HAMP domain-containing sensor histidine kinase [Calditrichia bacterium]